VHIPQKRQLVTRRQDAHEPRKKRGMGSYRVKSYTLSVAGRFIDQIEQRLTSAEASQIFEETLHGRDCEAFDSIGSVGRYKDVG